MTLFAYVGCYTTPERHGRGKGINVYRVDRAHRRVQARAAAWTGWRTRRSSRVDTTGRFLYSVHGDRSDVTAYAIDGKYRPSRRVIGRQPTGGYNPIHLAFDRDRPSSCSSPTTAPTSIAVLPGEAGRHARPLPDPDDASRARSGRIAPSRRTCGRITIRSIAQGRFFYVPNKGADSVIDLSPRSQARRRWSTSTKSPPAPAPAPRHIDFHPARASPMSSTSSIRRSRPIARIAAAGSSTPICRSCRRPRRTSPATAPAPRSRSIAPAATSTSPTAATTASACSRSTRPRARSPRNSGCRPRAACRASSAFDPRRALPLCRQPGRPFDRRLQGRARRQAVTGLVRVKVPSPACIVFTWSVALDEQDLRLRDTVDACRRRPRSGDRRAGAADLPDDGLRLRRCRPRRRAVQPADRGLHLFAPDQPDQCRARDAARDARRRPRLHRRRRRAMRRRCWRCSR